MYVKTCMWKFSNICALFKINNFSADLKRAVLSINRRCTDSLFHKSGAAYVNVLFLLIFPAGGVTRSLLSSDRRQRGGLYTDIRSAKYAGARFLKHLNVSVIILYMNWEPMKLH